MQIFLLRFIQSVIKKAEKKFCFVALIQLIHANRRHTRHILGAMAWENIRF